MSKFQTVWSDLIIASYCPINDYENEAILNREKKIWTIIGVIGMISLCIFGITGYAYLKFRKWKREYSLIIEEKDNLLNSASAFRTQYEIDGLGVLVGLAKSKDPAFFLKFNELNPDFKNKLLKKYPNLSLNDVEFCSYLWMNFNTKEIATYAIMSVRAVEAKKYRIRKKICMFSNININQQMMDI